jgi:hypothetical protein
MIVAVFFLLCWLFAGWAIESWAREWGYPSWPYFLVSLFLSPVLPAFVLLFKGPHPLLVEAKQLAQGKLKVCTRCAEAIRHEASLCKFCGSEQEPGA